ncbi:MAG: prepilin-type N-terminal cleavage/methylation domain-containing protein [Candidatus Dadabacteria bacterium]|nr:prepilin-type N-terminal cleavage/methylation domain-containing protein [Candidatus Dadabacteria bacterium]NIQ14982.1 prepilin-type N-terminal cleavage/methylation domain-containing protein [Candidatus Dadabacteria bacterium]
MQYSDNKGFNIIEVLLVATVISILVIMTGSISSKFVDRRSVDRLTNEISSNLNLAKLQSARHGVEYETVLTIDSDNKKLNIKTRRGSSNTGTDFTDSGQFEETSNVDFKMMKDYTIIPSDDSTINIQFNPNGRSTSLSITLKPAGTDSNVRKCGRIVVSPFGRIRARIGNWDFEESNPDVACKAIGDTQASPTPPTS